jgi:hypothetical protein
MQLIKVLGKMEVRVLLSTLQLFVLTEEVVEIQTATLVALPVVVLVIMSVLVVTGGMLTLITLAVLLVVAVLVDTQVLVVMAGIGLPPAILQMAARE